MRVPPMAVSTDRDPGVVPIALVGGTLPASQCPPRSARVGGHSYHPYPDLQLAAQDETIALEVKAPSTRRERITATMPPSLSWP
jgi:hypothetical protein